MRLERERVMAILRAPKLARVEQIAQALLEGGVSCVEITCNSEGFEEAIGALRASFGADLLVGAGTVLTLADATAAVDSGAEFLVAPHVDTEITAWAVAHQLGVMPGAMTPTEVHASQASGATAIKVFPATTVGPEFFSHIRGPFGELLTVAVGGVDRSNAAAFLGAGASAVGVGSWLLGDGEPSTVRDRACELRRAVDKARGARG